MRGFFEPVDGLLDLVDVYRMRSDADCELLLFESFWVRGGSQLQLNEFAGGLHSPEQAYGCYYTVERGTILPNDDRFAIASGLMEN